MEELCNGAHKLLLTDTDATSMINQMLVKPDNKAAVRTYASAVKPDPEL
ncbi:hypothetical protein WN51_04958 [Melipona quadrifasciata]|uniref:Uncharacterized protein n=1 Tax=Melipona quadrifasciata TaxID=166423 RepID=A0A0M8ZTJ0_9HYME|nr:hypothetical protein WN51_04958 [Melipona quadrifasciata]